MEAGMIIDAQVDKTDEFSITLSYEDRIGIIYTNDLAWVVSPRLSDYLTADNLLRVQITNVLEPSQNRPFSFFASRLYLAPKHFSKMIGYWHASDGGSTWDNQQFPHPEILVDPNWYPFERDSIVAYLSSGWTHTQWRGLSSCRFMLCGESSVNMGSACLTDGEWVWPEGLVHYIKTHDVQLPEEFITTMRNYNWNARNRYEGPHQVPKGEHDHSFWIDWCAQFTSEK